MKLLFLILRNPFQFIEFFIESKRYLKGHKRTDELPNTPYLTKENVTTAYPEDWYPECTTDDFNRWANYIHKQVN